MALHACVQVKKWTAEQGKWTIVSMFLAVANFAAAPTGSSLITRFLKQPSKLAPAHAAAACEGPPAAALDSAVGQVSPASDSAPTNVAAACSVQQPCQSVVQASACASALFKGKQVVQPPSAGPEHSAATADELSPDAAVATVSVATLPDGKEDVGEFGHIAEAPAARRMVLQGQIQTKLGHAQSAALLNTMQDESGAMPESRVEAHAPEAQTNAASNGSAGVQASRAEQQQSDPQPAGKDCHVHEQSSCVGSGKRPRQNDDVREPDHRKEVRRWPKLHLGGANCAVRA